MTDITIFPAVPLQALHNTKCDWCGESILVFTPYIYTRGIFDGRLEQMYFHPECFNAGANMEQKELEQITKFFKRGTTELKEEETK